MALSSPGIGSGLDVNSIVEQLVAVERRPIALLETAKTRLSSQLSSIGLLQSHMGNIQSSANDLSKAAFWSQVTATSSDASAVSATASASAHPATYTIEVTSLATAQSLSSEFITDPANVGTGTLTFTRGGQSVAVVIGSGDTSLEKIRDKINAADAGVDASIVKDASGSRLVLTGKDTGAAQAFTVGVSGATGELAGLAYPGGLTERRPAADAVLKINGLGITSASNTLDDVIDGLAITLGKEGTGPVTVSTAHDTAAMRKGIEAFIANYNAANAFLGTQTRYDASTKTAGALQGDRTAIGLQNALRGLVSQPSGPSAVFGRLSDLGISLQRDGSLKIENEGLLTAGLSNPAELAKLFSTPATGFATRLKGLADSMLGEAGSLGSRTSSLREGIRRNETDQARLEDRVARTQQRLLREYQTLDARMNTLGNLATYVTQQMTMLNNLYTTDK